MTPTRLIPILSGADRSVSAGAVRACMAAAEPVYRAVVAARNLGFDRGWRKARRLPRAVLSVGNLTVGGTGKTPMVIHLARLLQGMGRRPAVLLRGYGGGGGAGPDAAKTFEAQTSGGGGDEAAVLAGALGAAVPVAAGADRDAAAQRVLRVDPRVDLFLLDDGFQHRQVARDLDLVLIDATAPFGFDHVLPRGLLREPAAGLARARAVIVTRTDLVGADELAAVDRRIATLTGRAPMAHVAFGWTGLLDHHDAPAELGALRGGPVLGVCGVGNPGAFTAMFRREFGDGRVLAFPDHHRYTSEGIAKILRDANEFRCQALVMTEKDWVKWRLLLDNPDPAVPIYRPVLGTEVLDGQEALKELFRACL